MDHNTAEDSQKSKGRKTPIVIIDIKPNMPLGLLNPKNWRFFDYILFKDLLLKKIPFWLTGKPTSNLEPKLKSERPFRVGAGANTNKK